MTWTRVKRWIGMHPIRAIALVHFLLLATFFLSPVFERLGHPSLTRYFRLMFAIYPLLVLVLLPAWVCFVGCLLGRAGLRVERPWQAPLWVSVVSTTLSLPFWIAAWIGRGWEWWIVAIPFGSLMIGGIAALLSSVGTMIGLRLAERITQRKIRRGEWEVTVPPWAEDDLPPIPPPSAEEDSP